MDVLTITAIASLGLALVVVLAGRPQEKPVRVRARSNERRK